MLSVKVKMKKTAIIKLSETLKANYDGNIVFKNVHSNTKSNKEQKIGIKIYF